MFTPGETARALYIPPLRRRLFLRSATAVERIGSKLFQTFAGVLLVEATKQVYAATPGKAVERRKFVVLPGGIPASNRVSRREAPDGPAD
jgi:hypothetical protein